MEATPSLVACVRTSLLIIWASVSSERHPGMGAGSVGSSPAGEEASGDEAGTSGSVMPSSTFLMAS